MCEYCDASSDEENFSPDITVKEMRNGLYHIDLHFGVTGKIGIVEKTFQLCGSHSNRNYIIIYDDENHGNPEENTSGFILIVKEMPCNDPRISGAEIKRGKGKLFVRKMFRSLVCPPAFGPAKGETVPKFWSVSHSFFRILGVSRFAFCFRSLGKPNSNSPSDYFI